MKKLVLSLAWLVCCALTGFTQETPFVDGDLLVMLEQGVEPSLVTDEARIVDGRQTSIYLADTPSKLGRVYLFHYDHTVIDQFKMLDFVKRIEGVQEAQFNHYVQDRRAVPTDPDFGSQWHHVDASDNDIDSDLAWNTTTGGSTANGFNIVACVVEPSGMTWGHPDLVGNHWTNPGEIANNGIDDDGNGRIDDFDGWNTPAGNDNIANASHGAGVMGMIGAVANNGNGGVGVNWNIDLMPVVVGSLTEANVIAAYGYALDMRAIFNATNGASGAFVVVVNSSWGIDNANPASYPIWCGYYDTMGSYGILNCASTTNNNVNVDVVGDMPTGCSSQYLISVTATNSSDVRTFSGYGTTRVDLGAPGEAVWLPNSTAYQSWNGTSFASPCVAGAVGLLYSAPCASLGLDAISNPAATAIQVKNAIFSTVDQTAQLIAETSTGGRLNVNAALNALISSCGSAPGCVQLTMNDSFGDSWNGAVYNVYDTNGTLVASGTHSGGSSSVADICPGDGCYTLEITNGTFPAEISWSLTGANEGTLSGGAGSSTSFTIGGLVYGCTNAAACNYNASANCNDGSCCFANCVTVNMTDGFGDSWNGGAYTITDSNGTVVATGTHAGGSSSSNFLCLATGCYTMNVTGGTFPSEIGWSISGANGAVSGGAPATVSFTVGAVVYGCLDPAACNYNPSATCADGSCCYQNCVNLVVTAGTFAAEIGWSIGGYSGGAPFNGVLCLPSGCTAFNMTDSFGDGWNGATYTFTDQFGNVLATGTLSTGSAGSANVGVGVTNGCTNPAACNYNPSACGDDGSCCLGYCATLTMTDSFGDGWNGGIYTIYDNWYNVIATGTMDNGSMEVVNICLPYAGCYVIDVTGGFFPTEIGWTLDNINGGSLSGGAPSTFAFSVSTLILGCTQPGACNYDPSANCDDGTCCYENCVTLSVTAGAFPAEVGWSIGGYSGGAPFEGLLCLPSGCQSFTMTDSFGDTWNGATFTFTDQFGNILATGTHNGGSSSTANVGVGVVNGCTDPGACNYNPAACGNDGSCCFENCVTIIMTDVFGDSWNGGAYTITNSLGVVVASGTHEGGSSSSDLLCLADGCYVIDVTAGTFPAEIGWSISGANGSLSGGAPASLGFTVGSVVYGCMDPFACNYNFSATCEDGSCCYENCITLNVTSGTFPAEISWSIGSYSGGAPFNGVLCLPTGCLTFTMNDSFGDTWNGATYTFTDQFGNVLASGTHAGGSSSTANVGVNVPSGCTDPGACNYDPAACTDDGSCCYQNCVTLNMSDSFGDGWNGAVYTISDELGNIVTSGTLDYGSFGADILCLTDGCYTISVTEGFFPSEISWSISGANEVVSGGAPATASFTVGTVLYGCTNPFACNYDFNATCDDGTCCFENCITLEVTGGSFPAEVGWSIGGYSGGAPFNGMLCLPTGCLTFTMTDSFGDTWNGATFTFTDQFGNVLATGTHNGGPSSTANVGVGVTNGCTDPGACNYDPAACGNDGSCCYQNCVTINMNDSFGDGWNGGAYTVSDELGNVVATGTLADGSFGSDFLCLADGCYTIDVSGGFFPMEIGWSISGANEVVSGGAPATASFTVGTVIYGCTDSFACNYNFSATCEDGSCCYENCITLVVTGGTFPSEIGWSIGTYSGGAPFNGLLCLPDGCLTFNMTDGFGDSWNGGTFTFTDQFGNVLATGTHSGGTNSSANVGVNVSAGCTDPGACNYNPAACGDDGSCCYQNCVTINMSDGFGDGWNGAAYTVSDNLGNVVATGTLAGGSFGSDVLCLADGCYTIDVTGGTFPGEIGWSITGANESVSGGAPVSGVSFSVGAAVVGCTNCEAPNYNPLATCDDGSCLITCTGDFNGDYIIGTSDLLLFLGTFGSTPGACSQTDLTGDGIVGLADLLLFLGVFGTVCP